MLKSKRLARLESELHSIIIDYLRFHFINNNNNRNNCNEFDENSKRLKDAHTPEVEHTQHTVHIFVNI